MSGVPIIGDIADGLGKVLDAPLNAFNDLLGIGKKPNMPEAPKKDTFKDDKDIADARRKETLARGRSSTIMNSGRREQSPSEISSLLGNASRSLLGQ